MSLREVLRGMKEPAESAGTQVPGVTTAKSKDGKFTQVKVFLRKETHKRAARKCEDAGDGDFSDLVERLLQEYLKDGG